VVSAGGIVRYQLPDMEFVWLHAKAEGQGEEPTPLYDLSGFSPGEDLIAHSAEGYCEFDGRRWLWRQGSGPKMTGMSWRDRAGAWTLRATADGSGVSVERTDEFMERISRPRVLHAFGWDDVNGGFTTEGCLWLSARSGLYRLRE
jgi:hypothetical protein